MGAETTLACLAPDEFRRQVVRIAADRHSAEAAALYQVLFTYITGRVRRIAPRARLSECQRDEVVGDVLLQLMKGSLASFRGGSLRELLGYVRIISDRAVWKVVRGRDRERDALESAGLENMSEWTGAAPPPADEIELEVESPLPAADQAYLIGLLRAGSKAELARRSGVSRAAVTQRVKRIRRRITELGMGQQHAHDAWVHHQAQVALAFKD